MITTHTNEVLSLWKNALAALQPSSLVASLSTSILETIAKKHETVLGKHASHKFAVVHISASSAPYVAATKSSAGVTALPNGTTTAEDVSAVTSAPQLQRLTAVLEQTVNASDTLLVVSLGPSGNRNAILKHLAKSFRIVPLDVLLKGVRQHHLEREMSAAVEQVVAREALLFVGSSESQFSRLVMTTRCFAMAPLSHGLKRASVMFDRSAHVAACRADWSQ